MCQGGGKQQASLRRQVLDQRRRPSKSRRLVKWEPSLGLCDAGELGANWRQGESRVPSLPAKRKAGTGLLLEDATMSKLLWMLLVIGSPWADDDGRIHPKCVEESNTRRCPTMRHRFPVLRC